MKTRRVIKSGACLVVTLPAEFVRKHKIEKGSFVAYEIKDGKLTLTAVNVTESVPFVMDNGLK